MRKHLQAEKHKKLRRRLLYSWPVLLVLGLVVVWLGRSVWQAWQRAHFVTAARQETEEELSRWRARQEELAAEVAFLSTERGQEELIREKFSVAKEGERVINVISTPAETASTSPVSTPWWRSWGTKVWQWLAGIV